MEERGALEIKDRMSDERVRVIKTSQHNSPGGQLEKGRMKKKERQLRDLKTVTAQGRLKTKNMIEALDNRVSVVWSRTGFVNKKRGDTEDDFPNPRTAAALEIWGGRTATTTAIWEMVRGTGGAGAAGSFSQREGGDFRHV